MKMEAEAKGNYEIMSKQAEGFAKIVEAAGGDPDKAIQLIIADKLEDIMKIQVDAIKNIKIDKITVWDSGSGSNGNGESSTGNFLQSFFKTLPPMNDIFKMAGTSLPSMLNGEKVEELKEVKVEKPESAKKSNASDDSKEKK